MDLTQYKIEELIQTSNININKKEIYFKNLRFYAYSLLVAIALCITHIFPHPILSFVGASIITASKTVLQLQVPKAKKKKANQKLREVAYMLTSYGVYTSKLQLQKAKVNSKYVSCIIKEDGSSSVSNHDIIFEDRLGRLKALRQARIELYSFRFPFEHRIIGETRIIEDSEKAKQLAKTMKQD